MDLWAKFGASLVAQTVKNLPAMRETRIQSLGREDPLKKRMATHANISCLENSMERGAWRSTVHGVLESNTTEKRTLVGQGLGRTLLASPIILIFFGQCSECLQHVVLFPSNYYERN